MSVAFKVVIPARYASTRFPGKPLVLIKGKPMIQHVYERALESGAEEVIIATDDDRIEFAANSFGAKVCMTSTDHVSGSDRLAEVVKMSRWSDNQIVVNVQGDEPQIPPAIIKQVADNLQSHSNASIATLCTPIDSQQDILDPNIVKVVFDINGYALYFSRSVIPWFDQAKERTNSVPHYRHIGLYAYRADYLKRFANLSVAAIEHDEKLEQLRALWNGEKIHVDIAAALPGVGVDTPADLSRIS